MAFLNNVQLIGYLGKAPMLFDSKAKGAAFAITSLATNEPISNSGTKKNIVEWHQLLFHEDTLSTAKTLQKGEQLFIEGALCSQIWMDSAGQKHKSWNVVVSKVQRLSAPAVQVQKALKNNASKYEPDHTIDVADSHILAIKEALKK